MKKLSNFIQKYEDYILNREKHYKSMTKINLKTLIFSIVIIALTYFIGLLFNSLYNIGYLLGMSNVIVLSTYLIYKILRTKQYNEAFEQKYSLDVSILMNILYVLVILMSASLFLLFTVYFGYVSFIVYLIFIFVFISSLTIYILVYERTIKIELPGIYRLLLNGFFIGLLFYGLIMLIHINNITLSFLVVGLSLCSLIFIKQYLEKKFIFSLKRTMVVLAGVVIIALSYPFTRAFNYTSFYRNELTFDIMYDTLDGEVHEFADGITGDVIFFEDYIVIVEEDVIRFFSENFIELFTVENEYSSVYLMNEKLYANKVVDITSRSVDLYIFGIDSFNFFGEYFAFEAEDKVYVEENAYFSFNGTVFSKEAGIDDYDPIENDEIDDFKIAEQQENYIVFKNYYPFFANSESYMEPVNGVTYDRIAYNNEHLAFNYTSSYASNNEDKVDPDDGGRFVYLSSTEDYFSDSTEAAATIELPKLFRIDEFHYINGYYYLVGYVEYSTRDFNYKLLVINEEGDIEKDIIYEGPHFAISKDYMIYGDETLKVYPIDSEIVNTYRIIEGYGLMFFTFSLVSLFAIEKVHLNAKNRKIEKKREII